MNCLQTETWDSSASLSSAFALVVGLLALTSPGVLAAPDLVLADFEGDT